MRSFCAVLVTLMALGGCGNAYDMGPREITLEYPPDAGAAAQENANDQCKPFGKTATAKGSETRGNVTTTVFSCS